MWNKEKYWAYLNSPHWRKTRTEAINRSGHRCEFLRQEGQRGECYDRCPRRDGLQVHHFHYHSLGHESPEDLGVYCEFHHKVQDLLDRSCRRCGDNVLSHPMDAVNVIGNHGGNLEAARDAASLCDYCNHQE